LVAASLLNSKVVELGNGGKSIRRRADQQNSNAQSTVMKTDADEVNKSHAPALKDRKANPLKEHNNASLSNITNEPMLKKVRGQIEYYFGDKNYPRDIHLQNVAHENDGFVSINTLLTFKKLNEIFEKYGLEGAKRTLAIVQSVQDSEIVELNTERTGIRRCDLSKQERAKPSISSDARAAAEVIGNERTQKEAAHAPVPIPSVPKRTATRLVPTPTRAPAPEPISFLDPSSMQSKSASATTGGCKATIKRISSNIMKIQIAANGKPLTWREMLDHLAGGNGGGGRQALTEALRECSYPTFFFECPPLTSTSMDQSFECVLVDSPGLRRVTVGDPNPFKEHLQRAKSSGQDVAVFLNLGRTSTLVCPCAATGESLEPYGHIASVMRKAPEERVAHLWATISREVSKALREWRGPVYLSTCGLDVDWLHVRLDPEPKYYQYAPYRNMQNQD